MPSRAISGSFGLQPRAEISEVEARLRAEIRDVKLKLRAGMALLRADLMKWVVCVGIAAVIATGGMIVTLGVAILCALPHR